MKKITLEEVKENYTIKNAKFLRECYEASLTGIGYESIRKKLNISLESNQKLNQKVEFFTIQYLVWVANEKEREAYINKLTIRKQEQDKIKNSYRLRYCFWLCIAAENNREVMKQKNIFSISLDTVRYYARQYLLQATEQEKKLYEQVKEKNELDATKKKILTEEEFRKSKENMAYVKICNALMENSDNLEQVLKDNKVDTVTEVKRISKNYIESYRNAGFEQRAQELEEKLSKIVESSLEILKPKQETNKIRLQQQKEKYNEQKKQNLNLVAPFIKEYSKVPYYISLKEFYQQYKKTHPELTLSLENTISIIKQFAPETYKSYKDKVDYERKIRFTMIRNQIEQVLAGIVYGVKENQDIRDFNILDYFKLTSVSIEETERLLRKDLKIFLNKYTVSEIKKIKLFLENNKNNSTIMMEANLKKELTNMNIPLYKKVYDFALDAHLNGTLTKPIVINYPELTQNLKK